MTDREIIALNEDSSRIEAPQVGDRYVAPREILALAGIDIPSGQLVGDLDPEAAQAKLDLITVNSPVDLDLIADVSADLLNNVRLYNFGWDPNSGTFPSVERIGDASIVSLSGSLDGVDYYAGDVIIALVNSPAPVDSSEWLRIRGADIVTSVAGKTGDVTLEIADITDAGDFLVEEDIDTLPKLNLLVGETLDTVADARPPQAHAHAPADITGLPLILGYTYSGRDLASGTAYLAGFYDYDTDDANISGNGSTITHGNANTPYAAKAFLVIGAIGTDGTNVTIEVSGTSIDNAGVRVTSDTETLYTGLPGSLSTNDYLQTTKRWLGEVTFTLTSDGTTASMDANYGLVQTERVETAASFVLDSLEVTGLCDNSDASFDIQLIHHSPTGWTYAATGFVPGPTPICSLATDYDIDNDIVGGDHFNYTRSGLAETIPTGEGFLLRIVTSTNRAVAYMNARIGGLVSYN